MYSALTVKKNLERNRCAVEIIDNHRPSTNFFKFYPETISEENEHVIYQKATQVNAR